MVGLPDDANVLHAFAVDNKGSNKVPWIMHRLDQDRLGIIQAALNTKDGLLHV
jgi:hypothetical protein